MIYLVWVCPICATNNAKRAKRCCVCDQKRPPQAFKLKINRDNLIAIEDKYHTKLVGVMREFLRSLVALIGILLGVLLILRATEGELPEVLNTLTLLFEKGKVRVVDAVPDSAVYLWDRLGEPFTQVKDNFLYIIDGLDEKFKWIGKNFIALFTCIKDFSKSSL